MSELHLVGFFYKLLEHVSQLHDPQASSLPLLTQLHEQSLSDWPAPQEAISMAVRLNLLDRFIEEMIVTLPENLFQGLHAE